MCVAMCVKVCACHSVSVCDTCSHVHVCVYVRVKVCGPETVFDVYVPRCSCLIHFKIDLRKKNDVLHSR